MYMHNKKSRCSSCCFHLYTGPIWMVVPDGHVVVKCCQCEAMRTEHRQHVHDSHAPSPTRRWTMSP